MKTVENQYLRMPALGLGTWALAGSKCEEVVRLALDIGYRHIDTAEMYGNEAEIGAALTASSIAREEIFLTTKLWSNHLHTREVRPAIEASLRKLRTDHVDLLLIHWPNSAVPVGETLAAMEAVRREGKARAIGVSNFPVALLTEAVESCHAPVACNQIQFHLQHDQKPVLAYARAHDIVITAYSPLAKGGLATRRALQPIAAKHGKSPAQIALRWLVQQDGVAAIPKASSERNLRANIDIFDFALDAEDLAAIAR